MVILISGLESAGNRLAAAICIATGLSGVASTAQVVGKGDVYIPHRPAAAAAGDKILWLRRIARAHAYSLYKRGHVTNISLALWCVQMHDVYMKQFPSAVMYWYEDLADTERFTKALGLGPVRGNIVVEGKVVEAIGNRNNIAGFEAEWRRQGYADDS